MATIQKRKNKDGSTSYVAWVRIKPFRPVSKSFRQRKAAAEWADDLERELRAQREHGGVRADVATLTVRDLAQAFLEDPDVQALRSYETLELRLAWWVNHYGGERALGLNVLKLREARDKLRPGREPATVNRYLAAMRSCWNWGRAAGLIPHNNLWPRRLMLTERNTRQRYLTDAELDRLLEAAQVSPVMNAAIVVSLACGLRQGELLRLRWADVDFEKQRLRIMVTKTDTPRSVYLPSAAVAAIKALKRGSVVSTRHVFLNDDGEPLDRYQLDWKWQGIRKAARLADFRWHDLRHSCASFLAQQGASLLEIGTVLGHSSPSVTRRYAHLVAGAPVTGHSALDAKLKR